VTIVSRFYSYRNLIVLASSFIRASLKVQNIALMGNTNQRYGRFKRTALLAE